MSFKTTVFCVLMGALCHAQQTSEPITIFDKLLFDHYKHDEEASIENPTKLAQFLSSAKEQELEETKFRGQFGFGLTLNNSENRDLTQFNVSAKIRRGFFPGNFKFFSELNVQLQDGSFVENFSNLSMSYDHHIGNDLTYEGYIFLRRSTNNFLNISQRYETGIGIVWNTYLSGKKAKKGDDKRNKKLLTTKGASKFKEITDYETVNGSKSLATKDNQDFFSSLCSKTMCLQTDLDQKESSILERSLNRTIKSIQKMESKVRISFLVGINYETEKTSEDLTLFGTTNDTIGNFVPVNLFRAVVGPNLELSLSKLTFNTKVYGKLGISDSDLNNQVFSSTQTFVDEKIDYRLEWTSIAELKFNQHVSVSSSFRYVHINAPRRQYFITTDGEQLFSAANRFTNFKMGLTYKF